MTKKLLTLMKLDPGESAEEFAEKVWQDLENRGLAKDGKVVSQKEIDKILETEQAQRTGMHKVEIVGVPTWNGSKPTGK